MPDIPKHLSSVLQSIIRAIQAGKMRFTTHAQAQMAIRHITNIEIVESLTSHSVEIIENYPDDKYSPSCLIYGFTKSGRILHVQSNYNAVIITSYDPDPKKAENTTMVKCPVCQNHMVRKTIRYTQEWNGKLVAFDNVPADVCETCGEQLLEGHIVDKINQTLWSMEPPHGQLQVPLYDLAVS